MKKINMIVKKEIYNDWLNKVELTLTGFKYNPDKSTMDLSVVITKDSNNYGDEGVSNIFEKFSIHATNISKEQQSTLAIGKKVKLEKITNVTTYGDYSNNLSVTGQVQING